MKNILVAIALFSLISCRTIQNSINDSMQTMALAIFPDSCEIQLIVDVSKYSLLHSSLPDSIAIRQILLEIATPCQQTIKNIKTIIYNKDSMDISLTKIFMDTTLQSQQMKKGYRLIFSEDSLRNMRLLHFKSPHYHSELFPFQKINYR
ncbi:MAG: hypothetical protein K1X82_02265 [Bacteroidia bacterium]|nr:hypothetical protein [Bacteroidia bacterium]